MMRAADTQAGRLGTGPWSQWRLPWEWLGVFFSAKSSERGWEVGPGVILALCARSVF